MNIRRLKVEPSAQDSDVDRYVLSAVILSSNTVTDAECPPPPPSENSKIIKNVYH